MSTSLLNDLKSVIDRYLEGHRSRNLASLSRVSGVAYTTLRRFAQMEGHPTAEPVLKILDSALPTNEKIEFIRKHFPEIASSITNFSKHEYSRTEPSQEAVKMFLRRAPHNFIFNLALNVGGTTVDTIKRLHGERGLEALDEMLESGVLDRDRHGVVRYCDPALLSFDCDTLIDQIRNAGESFDRSLIGTDMARIWHLSAGLSKEGIKKIHEIVSRAFVEISEINHDPRYFGNIPYFTNMMMNLYDKKPYADQEN